MEWVRTSFEDNFTSVNIKADDPGITNEHPTRATELDRKANN